MASRSLTQERKAKIVKLYVEEKLTIGLIRERLGNSYTAIAAALREAGVNIEQRRKASDVPS